MATIQWTGGSGDGVEADSYSGFASGSSRMNVPFAVYAPNAQYTVFSVQNTESATTANITMKWDLQPRRQPRCHHYRYDSA